MTVQQLLSQFSFVSMAECRRFVVGGNVSIDGRVITFEDLDKNALGIARVGSIIKIGKRLSHEIKEEHFKKCK